MNQEFAHDETQEFAGHSEEEVKCAVLKLIVCGCVAESLSDELRVRIVDLLKGLMITDSAEDVGVVGDEHLGASNPGSVEMAAMRLITLNRPTRALIGMKRWKVERLFKRIIGLDE